VLLVAGWKIVVCCRFALHRLIQFFSPALDKLQQQGGKQMKLIGPLSVALVLAVGGCASDQTAAVKSTGAGAGAGAGDSLPCVTNFSVDGGFWTGRQFKTFQVFPKASKSSAFDDLLPAIASIGYQIKVSDKENGLISGSYAVALGKGETNPLSALIKANQSGGVRVDLVFSINATGIVSTDSVRDEFCNILAKVRQTKEAAVPAAQQGAPKEPAASSVKTKKK